MTVAAIIQARMGSTRLPGKTLEPLGDLSVLEWTVTRASMSSGIDVVIVATSTGTEDDEIAARAERLGVTCVRGSSYDVLSRYAVALEHTDADVIVRITADCPLIDPEIVTHAVATLRQPGEPGTVVDYVSTSLDGRYPRGLDVEVVRRDVLVTANAEASEPDEREHVTLFIYRRPERFVCRPVPAPEWARRPDLRFTVDEPADLALIRAVVSGLAATPPSLSGKAVVAFLDQHPEIAAINEAVTHRTVR